MRLRLVCSLCIALCGCQVNVHIPETTARNIVVGVALGLVVADAAGYFERDDEMPGLRSPGAPGEPPRRRPEPDPARAVSEQDCLRPVDPTLGNLKCH